MKRSTDRILTSHSGSLPRPRELHDLLVSRGRGEAIDGARFDELLRQSVADIAKKQAEYGIDVINDGEHSRVSFASYMKERLTGFEVIKDEAPVQQKSGEAADFPEFFARPNPRVADRMGARTWCVGPIDWKDFSQVERDIANLKAAVAGLEVTEAFITSASPDSAARFQPNRYYATDEQYRQALADVIKREYRAIVDAGFVLQVDYPITTPRFYAYDSVTQADLIREDTRREVARDIDFINYALEGIPADRVRLHVCFGSAVEPHNRDTELGVILDLLLKANVGGYTLVGATGRHEHEWRDFQNVKMTDERVVVLGVIDHTTNVVEHPQTVADRITWWANVIGRENVIAGTDCGFATGSGAEDYRADGRVMWAKFEAMVKGAEIASKRLWS